MAQACVAWAAVQSAPPAVFAQHVATQVAHAQDAVGGLGGDAALLIGWAPPGVNWANLGCTLRICAHFLRTELVKYQDRHQK